MEEKIQKPQILIKGGDNLERTGKFIKPNVTDLRNHDADLLGRFKPKYYSFIQQCQYCAFGPCDLSKNRKGACGMRLNPQMAREALVTSIAGASSYITRAYELNDAIIKEHTYFPELNLEDKNFTTFINLLCGYEPKVIGDLKKALRYANEQIVHMISATHMGQETSDFDFNSKTFHAGMQSLLAMEVYEILMKFLNSKILNDKGLNNNEPYEPNNDKGNKINKKTFEIGFGAIDKGKGIVLIIGDYAPNIAQIINSSAGFEIMYLGSGAFDFNERVKIGGNFTPEFIYEKARVADVIIIGTGNVRTDVIENVKKSGTPVIAVSDTNIAGLPDVSVLNAAQIFKKLIDREISGCYIKDSKKLADVVGMVAAANKKKRDLKIYNEKFMNKKGAITVSNTISIPKDAQILLVLGDANFPNGTQELVEILNEFLNRNLSIYTAGDVAISIAESNLTHENLINLGSLPASIHIIEKIVEMASKGINKSPVGNYDEISDYIVNRISIVALFWGATTQENFAYASGLMRLGIPVIFGKQGIKYRKELRGDIVIDYSKDDYNGNYNEILKKISPKDFLFPHLCIAANTKEEAMLLISKLIFRNFDSEEVRAKKIENYVEIYKKYGDKTKEIPDDIKNFVRSEKDIPEAYKNSIQSIQK